MRAAHKFNDALVEARRTVSLDSTLAISHWLTGLVLLALDHPDSALVAFTRSIRLGNTPDARPELVRVYRALGRTHDADTTYASLVRTYRLPQGEGRDMAIGRWRLAICRLPSRRSRERSSGATPLSRSTACPAIRCWIR